MVVRWRALVGGVAVLVVTAGCGVGSFTIDELEAATHCSGTGTWVILASGEARALGDIDVHLSSAGMPTPWCEGLVHRWPEGGEISGYEFTSDPSDPLEFTVGADGYVYRGGTGTVTTPEGKIIELP